MLGKLQGTVKNNCVDEDQSFNEKTESGHGGMSL